MTIMETAIAATGAWARTTTDPSDDKLPGGAPGDTSVGTLHTSYNPDNGR